VHLVGFTTEIKKIKLKQTCVKYTGTPNVATRT